MLGVDVIYEDFVTGTEMQVSFYIDTPLIATGDCDFYTSLLREKRAKVKNNHAKLYFISFHLVMSILIQIPIYNN